MWVTPSMASLGCKLGWLGLCVAVGQAIGGGLARADSEPAKADAVAMGNEIFNREWMPNDLAATAATSSGRSATILPASPATIRAAAAVQDP